MFLQGKKAKIPYEMLKNRKCPNIGGEVVSGAVTHANDFKQNPIKNNFFQGKKPKTPYENFDYPLNLLAWVGSNWYKHVQGRQKYLSSYGP